MKYSAIILVLFICSCKSNPPERNSIVFNDSFDKVCDSIFVVVNLMENLSNESNIDYYSFWRDGTFSFGGHKFNNTAEFLEDSLNLLSNYSPEIKLRLVVLLEYLRDNHLSGCFRDFNAGDWSFHYRLMIVENDDDYRLIIPISDPAVIKNVKNDYEIIEMKKDIFLVAIKGAVIR